MEKQIGDIVVNDGKGLFDNEGLTETLIADLNNLIRALLSQQYIICFDIVVQMCQKITNLQKGIRADTDDLKYQVADLKRLNTELMDKINGGVKCGSSDDTG